MKIIDCHRHFFAESNSDIFIKDLKDNNIISSIIMGTNSEFVGALMLPIATPNDSYYCCGLRSSQLSNENENITLKALENEYQKKSCVGLKLYSGYETFFPDAKEHTKFLELTVKYKKVLVTHGGATVGTRGELKYSHPLAIDSLAAKFPDLKVVISHLGNPWIVDAVAVAAKHENVYLDFSGLIEGDFTVEDFKNKYHRYLEFILTWIEYLGDYKKLLFGTDWPISNTKEYIKLVKHLVPKEYHNDVFYNNSKRVFNLMEDL